MDMEILFLYKGQFLLGKAYLLDEKFNLSFGDGVSVNLDNVGGVWTLDEHDGVQVTTINYLNSLLSPLRDRNGCEVYVDDYVANIQDEDRPVVYQIRSINETTVSLKVIHDSFCPFLSTMRDKITASWVVIPCKKN